MQANCRFSLHTVQTVYRFIADMEAGQEGDVTSYPTPDRLWK